MHDDSVFCYSFGLFNPSDQVAQLTVNRPAAAAATSQIEHAIGLVLWVSGKAAGAFVECLLAIVAGAAFLDNVALHYDDIIFVLHISHIFGFLI